MVSPNRYWGAALTYVCLTKVSVFESNNELAHVVRTRCDSQMPTPEAVVRILPYFCFWKIGQTALMD
jgi:hypothetical protein